ncbi:hypothetical protein DAEQUDRAFT_731084 [Daedalea quercina L-15889]|uniref:Uncharacterized protein n=1 Tax=Daedalea quercina L-15889 TaxID=1314783 RepID=A0A165MJZ9_9APHY|nr:hypothetical protein DAEQUDRAFT_731084 [Daedalea quercina L-15889]
MSWLYYLRAALHTLRLRLPYMSDIHLNRLLVPYGEGSYTGDQACTINSLEFMYVNGNPRIHECIISEIVLWKAKTLPNHEFLIATVKYDGHVVGALRIERTVMPTESRPVNASSVSLTSTSSSTNLFAHDHITVCCTDNIALHTTPAQMIARHSPATPINIAYVVAACAVLNKASPEYDVFRKQCYWYAGLAFRLLVGDDVMRQLQYNGPQRAGEVANFFSVMKEPELDRHARELRPLYEDKLQAIQYEVTERRRKERRAEDAERVAEEAKRRAEAAEREVGGARRRAEEEEREAEGARREAEAAVRRAAEMEIELQKLKELNQGARTSAGPSA